jgi:hypothetical protein
MKPGYLSIEEIFEWMWTLEARTESKPVDALAQEEN